MRNYWPAALHTASLAIALFTQRMDDWPASAWIFFFFAGCAALVFDGEKYKTKSLLRMANAAWLITIGTVILLIDHTYGITPEIWVFAAAPMLALALKEPYLKSYLWGFGGVLAAFALTLVVQFIIYWLAIPPENAGYTWFFTHHEAAAWPMIDPNNAALVMNCGLVASFLTAPWFALLFALALFATGSKAGVICACAACGVLTIARFGWRWWYAALLLCAACAARGYIIPVAVGFTTRFPIWDAAASLLAIHPLTGLGFGMFANYYAHVRTEHYTSGFFAHNDALQIAVEMGIPAALVFLSQWAAVARETCRANLVAAMALAVVLLQSMVEFQFYVPAVALLTGLAMAWHSHHRALPRKR